MSHWVKVGLLVSVTAFGLSDSSRAAFLAVGKLEATSTLMASWAQASGENSLAAATTAANQGNEGASNQNNRPIWGLLITLSLLIMLVSVIVLVSRRRSQSEPLSSQPLEDAQSDLTSHHQHWRSQFPPVNPKTFDQNYAVSASSGQGLPNSELPSPNSTGTWDEPTRLVPVNIVDTLISELGSTDGSVRRKAIWELGQRGNSAAVQPLVNAMLDADSQERSLILAALGEISSRHLKPLNQALALALQDPSPEVRKNAIRDLTRIYENAVHLSHFLAHATQDDNSEVQETAHWALGQLNQIQMALSPNSQAFERLPVPESEGLPDSPSSD